MRLEYRYGFNGKENDDEVKGAGNSIDFGARVYDPRLGRWFATDPLESKYPGLSTYAFVANDPINAVDPDGKDIIYVNSQGQITKIKYDHSPLIKIVEAGSNNQKNFADFDITSSFFDKNSLNRQIVANVAGFYGKGLGVKKGVSFGAISEKNNSLAFTTPDKRHIYILIQAMKLGKSIQR